jgi:hypothetical protein
VIAEVGEDCSGPEQIRVSRAAVPDSPLKPGASGSAYAEGGQRPEYRLLRHERLVSPVTPQPRSKAYTSAVARDRVLGYIFSSAEESANWQAT